MDGESEQPDHLAPMSKTYDNTMVLEHKVPASKNVTPTTAELKDEDGNDQTWDESWYAVDDSIENPEAPSHAIRLKRLPANDSEDDGEGGNNGDDGNDNTDNKSSNAPEDESDPGDDLDYYFSQPEPNYIMYPMSWRKWHAKRLIYMSFWDYDDFEYVYSVCKSAPSQLLSRTRTDPHTVKKASNANKTLGQLIEEEVDSILGENGMTKETVFITILAEIYLAIGFKFRVTCIELEEKFADDLSDVEKNDDLLFAAEESQERFKELSYYGKLAVYCERRYKECMDAYYTKLATTHPGLKRKRCLETMTRLTALYPFRIKKPRVGVTQYGQIPYTYPQALTSYLARRERKDSPLKPRMSILRRTRRRPNRKVPTWFDKFKLGIEQSGSKMAAVIAAAVMGVFIACLITTILWRAGLLVA